MDPAHAAADDGALRWLRVLLAVSVLAPALVFVASAWLDYGQTLAIGSQQVDRTLRIAHEHALKVFETTELIIGRVEELVGERSSDALRTDRAALDERLAAVARSVPQVQSVFVLDAEGIPIATSPAPPGALANRAEAALLQQVRDGDGYAVSGALVPGGQDEPVYTVAKRRTASAAWPPYAASAAIRSTSAPPSRIARSSANGSTRWS